MILSLLIITTSLAALVSPSPIPGRFSPPVSPPSRMSGLCSLFLGFDFNPIYLSHYAKISIPEGKSLYGTDLYIELRIRAEQLFYFSES